jgi:hypothetical protein
MTFGKYAVIVWRTQSDFERDDPGAVYGWYEHLGTAINTALDLQRNNLFWHAAVLKTI